MVITTPSGYKVTLKEEADLTYRDRRSIQRVFLSKAQINNENNKSNINLNATTILDAQEALLKLIIVSIADKDGKALDGDLFEVVMNWKNPADADAVFDVVDELFAKINNSKKK
jgi:hypothetical protein